MSSALERGAGGLPTFLQRLSSDEYVPMRYTSNDLSAIRHVVSATDSAATKTGLSQPAYVASRYGTALGLQALNVTAGEQFYEIPREATKDRAAAVEAFGDATPVIDVQTHFLSDRPGDPPIPDVFSIYASLGPDWWTGLEGVDRYNVAQYMRCVFLETNNLVAILTSAPYEESLLVSNEQMVGTRKLVEALGGTGRLRNHVVVVPTDPGQIESMDRWDAAYTPLAWKTYTQGVLDEKAGAFIGGWMLDDEEVGIPFLERVRQTSCKIVCAHKGVSGMVDCGSPRDIGPVARAFRDLVFIVYHSGYEMPMGDSPEEGPYAPETAHEGVNRLITSLREAGVGPGENVYAELGTTWFSLIRRPAEAAHVLGKLLLAVGEDNVLWGTDSIWYGPPQPALDAFRAFQIPAEYRERYGYPELTAEIKKKILALNAARVYGLDLRQLTEAAAKDDLSWARAAVDEYRAKGVPEVFPA
jgi:hypothetical protein